MPTNYTAFVQTIANLLVVPSDDTNYQSDLPNIIADAELRIYRELDLLNTVVRDTSGAVSTGTRIFNLPSANGTFVTVQDINLITPAGTVNPDNGTRNPLLPASKEMLDFLYPSVTGSTVPQYFAMVSQSTVVLGPWPAAAYQAEVVGTIRPTPLSSSNQTTLLTEYFEDLFIAAAMVRGAGLIQNFGIAVDDPKMAITWEGHYQARLKSATVEEARKKFTAEGWSSAQPSPVATPPRT